MCALSNAIVEKRFVVVGEFVEKFPKRLNLAIEVIMGVISLVFFFGVGWYLIGQIDSSILFKEAYFMVRVPRWPFYCILGISMLACTLGTIVYVYEKLVGYKDPSEKTFIDEPELSILGLSTQFCLYAVLHPFFA
jgi:TRAP-type C4-dicarboxylate transport system permease small subunit